MNICTFGSSGKKVRSRCHFAVTTDLNFDLLFWVVVCVGVPLFNGSSGYQPYRLLMIVFLFLLQRNNIFH